MLNVMHERTNAHGVRLIGDPALKNGDADHENGGSVLKNDNADHENEKLGDAI